MKLHKPITLDKVIEDGWLTLDQIRGKPYYDGKLWKRAYHAFLVLTNKAIACTIEPGYPVEVWRAP